MFCFEYLVQKCGNLGEVSGLFLNFRGMRFLKINFE